MNTIHISELILVSNLQAFDTQYEASEIEQEVEKVFIKSGTDLIEAHYEQYALQAGSVQAYVYIYRSTDGTAIGYQHEIFSSTEDEESDSLVAMIAEDFAKKMTNPSEI